MLANLCLFLQQSFSNQQFFCGAVNNVIAVDYNNVFPVKYGIHR